MGILFIPSSLAALNAFAQEKIITLFSPAFFIGKRDANDCHCNFLMNLQHRYIMLSSDDIFFNGNFGMTYLMAERGEEIFCECYMI